MITNTHSRLIIILLFTFVCVCPQEGENNDKFFTHPRSAHALSAYLFAHNHLFYVMELLTAVLLMLLSLSEAPAVPFLRLDVYVSDFCLHCVHTLPLKSLGSVRLFAFERNKFFIQQGCITLIKRGS